MHGTPSVKTILMGFLMPIIAAFIFIIVWNVTCGRFYLIWEDECGKGNGQLHTAYDENTGEIFRYRFSDFRDTNGVYEISIDDKAHRFFDYLSLNVEKKDRYKRKVCAGGFVLERSDDDRWLNCKLPPQFAPDNVDETIEMVLVNPPSTNESERIIKFNLHSRKVWSFPSI